LFSAFSAGAGSGLYPIFMASVQKITIANVASLSKVMPQLFQYSPDGGTITSMLADTTLPRMAYLSRYLTYGLLGVFMRRE